MTEAKSPISRASGADASGVTGETGGGGEAGGEQRTLVRRAGWVGLLTLVSRVLGMIRDMVIAALFPKAITDAFFVAFTIPNVLRRLVAEGTLTVAVIPVFTDYRRNHGYDASRRFLDSAATTLGLFLLGLSILGVLAAPLLVRLFAWGFADDAAKFDLAVGLTRVMFPYIFFVSLMALCMGVLNTLGHFTAPALAPVLLNICMIGGALALWKPMQAMGWNPIYGLAAGVILGGLAQLLMQLPVMSRFGYLPRLRAAFGHPGVKRVMRLMAPAVFGLALYQINVVLSRLLASFLEDGAVTYIYYAQRLTELPMGIFAVAVATAAMPSLSTHANSGDMTRFKEVFRDSLRLTLFIVIPAMVGLLAVGEPIIAVLFERGKFTPAMSQATAHTLAAFAVGMWAAAGIRLTVPAFYALEDSRTPVRVAAIALVVYLAAGLSLMWPLSYVGLALAISISSVVNFGLLLWLLRKRLGRLGLRSIAVSATKSSFASIAMGVAAWGMCRLLAYPTFARGWGRLGVVLGAVIVAGGVYAAVAYLLRCPELGELATALRRRGRR